MKILSSEFYELDPRDRAAFRRFYRTLRIAVYAPQSYTGPEVSCYQGSYGLSRREAKQAIAALASEVNWYAYLGSK